MAPPLTPGDATPTTSILDALAEVLLGRGTIKAPVRRGGLGNLVEGPTVTSQTLRWLAAQRSSIAECLRARPGSISSREQREAALRDRYGSDLARALSPVVEVSGITTLLEKAQGGLSLAERIMVLSQLGLWRELIPLLDQFLRTPLSTRDGIVARNNLAYSLARVEPPQLERALALGEEALRGALALGEEGVLGGAEKPRLEAMVNDTLALIHLGMGHAAGARQHVAATFEAARKTGNDNPVEHFRAWQVYRELGDPLTAETHLRKACKLVGGPRRLQPSVDLVEQCVSEEEIAEIVDTWLAASGGLIRLAALFEDELRRSVGRRAPRSERDVTDVAETLMRGAGLECVRERERIRYSAKDYVPDFVVSALRTVVEVKFAGRAETPKRLIAEMNDDKAAYQTRYPCLLFLVYDRGFIENVACFREGIEEVGVQVQVIKH